MHKNDGEESSPKSAQILALKFKSATLLVKLLCLFIFAHGALGLIAWILGVEVKNHLPGIWLAFSAVGVAGILSGLLWRTAIVQDRFEKLREQNAEVLQRSDLDRAAKEEAVDALSRSRAHLQTVVNNAPVVLWATDESGIFTLSDGKGLKSLGLKPGEVVGQSAFEVYRDLPIVLDFLHRAMSGERVHGEVQIGPCWYDSNYTPIVDIRGQVSGVVGLATDITERKKTEIELVASQAQLREIAAAAQMAQSEAENSKKLFEITLQQLPVAVIIGEAPSGKIIFANTEGNRFSEQQLEPQQQAMDLHLWKGIHADGLAYTEGDWPLVRSIWSGEVVVGEETIIERNDGSAGFLRLSSAPVCDRDGKIVAGVMICEDYTSRKKIQDERIALEGREQAALESSRLKSEFLANMSHEIRTPINGVLGMVGLLIDSELSPEQREFAGAIKRSGDALLTVVNDILDLSKIEAGKLEFEMIDFPLQATVEDIRMTIAYAAQKRGLQFICTYDPKLPLIVKGDPGRLLQVISNLLSNALKFTSEGQIELRVRLISSKGITAQVMFEVEDSGIGISPDTLKRLFVSFAQADSSTTRRFGGTGLGLSISKSLVERMGGEIGVGSREGRGSCFWFQLPLKIGSMPRVTESVEQERSQEHFHLRARILIAEDVQINQVIAVKILERMGYLAEAVGNGQEALRALEQIPYDLVLMDCQMPEMDGYEASQLIRKSKSVLRNDIPIIAMTANAMKGDKDKCLECGMNDYVSKPVEAATLAAVLMKWLKKAEEPNQKDSAPA